MARFFRNSVKVDAMRAPSSHPLLLVDASVYIFRAWHSLPDSLTTAAGEPANAVYGFGDFLAGLLAGARPRAMAVAFDESLESSFRNEIYPGYKSNRESAPPELKAQIAHCQTLARALGAVTLVSPRYEADDLSWYPPDAAAVTAWCDELGLGGRLRGRLLRLADTA
jgi:5'-3' exonuclease